MTAFQSAESGLESFITESAASLSATGVAGTTYCTSNWDGGCQYPTLNVPAGLSADNYKVKVVEGQSGNWPGYFPTDRRDGQASYIEVTSLFNDTASRGGDAAVINGILLGLGGTSGADRTTGENWDDAE